MKSRVWLVRVLSLLAFTNSLRLPADEFPVAEYDKAVRQYLLALEGISVSFRESDQAVDGSVSFSGSHQFVSIPGYMRVKSEVTVRKPRVGPVVKTEWVLLRPDGYFRIEERAKGQFVLKSWQKEVTSAADVGLDSPICFLTMPVCRAKMILADLIRGKYSNTHAVRPVSFAKCEPAAFSLTTQDAINGGRADTRYEFNDKWLLTKYVMTDSIKKDGLSTDLIYESVDGRLLPSRITANRFDGIGRLASPGFEATFGPYSAFDGSRKDFSLDQFGIPETALYATPGRWASKNWLYLLAAALGFAALSFAMWRRSRRGGPTPAGAH